MTSFIGAVIEKLDIEASGIRNGAAEPHVVFLFNTPPPAKWVALLQKVWRDHYQGTPKISVSGNQIEMMAPLSEIQVRYFQRLTDAVTFTNTEFAKSEQAEAARRGRETMDLDALRQALALG